MTRKVIPKLDNSNRLPVVTGGFAQQLAATGRLPPVALLITPLDPAIKPFTVNKFLTYSFTSSVIIPVDTFSFTLAAPDDPRPITQIIREGDLVTLFANGISVATGIIDQLDIEVDGEFGETVRLSGRDLMGQLEDHSMVSLDSSPIFFTKSPIETVIGKIIENTRIPGLIKQNATDQSISFAGEPSESKLSALQRFLEPLNCLAWTDGSGRIIIGRPNMSQASSGKFYVNKSRRASNCLDMKAAYSAALVPNYVIPIWAGQETVVDRIGKEQGIKNASKRPASLYNRGHRQVRTVLISLPEGSDPQSISQLNFLQAAAASKSTLLQATAKREFARQNHKELIVQVVVASHYNEKGEPFVADRTYDIEFDRAEVNEKMYCFQVDYSMAEDGGQKTSLYFCKLGTIVSDINIT